MVVLAESEFCGSDLVNPDEREVRKRILGK